MKKVSVKELYSHWARSYDENNLVFFLEEQETKDWLNVKGKSILDLGCGTGRHSIPLAARNEVVGVDFSSEMLAIARKKAEGKKLDLELVEKEILDFKPEKKFDIILSLFVLDHIEDTEAIAKMLSEASKKDTELLVANVHPRFSYLSSLRENKSSIFGGFLADEYYHSLGEYLAVFRKYGFELVDYRDLIFSEKYFRMLKVQPEIKNEFLGVLYKFRRMK